MTQHSGPWSTLPLSLSLVLSEPPINNCSSSRNARAHTQGSSLWKSRWPAGSAVYLRHQWEDCVLYERVNFLCGAAAVAVQVPRSPGRVQKPQSSKVLHSSGFIVKFFLQLSALFVLETPRTLIVKNQLFQLRFITLTDFSATVLD